jgi:D-3-phosphoglycerate dehydrogenase
MNKILVTTSSFAKQSPHLLLQLSEKGFEIVFNPFGRSLSEKEVANLIKEYKPVGIIAGVEPLTMEVLSNADGLRVISRCGIGLDSVDLEAARKLGIAVTNTPDAPTIPVAELTLGLILALLRGIPASDAGIRNGKWFRPMGQLLHGKTVGIIGCGRIGKCVANLLSVFGCRLLGYDPVVSSAGILKLVSLDRLLSESDIITLHLPYTEKTHHIIDEPLMRSMKKGAFVVNAARGGLIDEQALFKCLQDGQLRGAALDCFKQEPYIGPLKEMGNVVLTGHIGSYAKEGRAQMEEQAVNNLLQELMKNDGLIN